MFGNGLYRMGHPAGRSGSQTKVHIHSKAILEIMDSVPSLVVRNELNQNSLAKISKSRPQHIYAKRSSEIKLH